MNPNFRVKLDLSKFYHDVRRFSWIFIDGSKTVQMCQVKEHITKLFGIKEPFHLLLHKTEYLPPNEDVRIIKENEMIMVIPGSGLDNEPEMFGDSTVISESRNESIKIENVNNVVRDKESQTMEITQTKHEPFLPAQQEVPNDVLSRTQSDASGDMMFYSVVDDSEMGSTAESRITDGNLTEDISMIENLVPIPKKKRIRHRKPKNQTQHVEVNNKNEDNRPKKPKIIDSFIISSSKHIRFDNIENEDTGSKQSESTVSTNGCLRKSVSTQDLCNLLSLRQSSTPVTFTSRRVKEEVKVEQVENQDARASVRSDGMDENVVPVKTEANKRITSKEVSYTNLQDYPLMTRKPEIKDVIAFKMLKIAEDYTPQVSNFIVAQVIAFCPKSSVYTFAILQGMSEVQVPIGKFSIIQDETERVMDNTTKLNYAQIMDARLICACDSSSTDNPSRFIT